jgi:hypothetical protein
MKTGLVTVCFGLLGCALGAFLQGASNASFKVMKRSSGASRSANISPNSSPHHSPSKGQDGLTRSRELTDIPVEDRRSPDLKRRRKNNTIRDKTEPALTMIDSMQTSPSATATYDEFFIPTESIEAIVVETSAEMSQIPQLNRPEKSVQENNTLFNAIKFPRVFSDVVQRERKELPYIPGLLSDHQLAFIENLRVLSQRADLPIRERVRPVVSDRMKSVIDEYLAAPSGHLDF